MKILLFTITLFLSGFFAFAQKYYPTPDVNNEQVVLNANDYEHMVLLNRENDLLQSRKVALTISVVGAGVGAFGAVVETPEITFVGGATVLVGSLWLLINEYKLINVQRRINNSMILQINPNGLALRF